MLAGAEGRARASLGEGARPATPNPQRMETTIPGGENLELWATSRKEGPPTEGPSRAHRPLLPPGCLLAPSSAPHFRGVGNAVMGGWVAAGPGPRGVCPPGIPFPSLVLPIPHKGLKTEGATSKGWHLARKRGAPLPTRRLLAPPPPAPLPDLTLWCTNSALGSSQFLEEEPVLARQADCGAACERWRGLGSVPRAAGHTHSAHSARRAHLLSRKEPAGLLGGEG